MTRSTALNDVEQFVLLALVRLGEGAYGVPIRAEIEERAQRPVSMAAVYAALDRMKRGGLVEAEMSAPRPERGGRARKYFRLTEAGTQALEDARAAMSRMWDGVELSRDATAR
jgi:DNA-binding PadR family transcriptional regulator